MKIEVLGTGCTTCNTVEAIVKEAVAKSGINAEVKKVSNRLDIAKTGVKMTPAVIIDGQIKLVGKIPEIEDVLGWLRESTQ
ncbi:MAG: TM0996/MTH895 family glutaredoxin-like protein [Deltaproteobacteria bacterium]|nr:TM0996/MTH895 family glutaredoxin-like protein [Deltaproteobacteria bacterium]MBW2042608.1 TM0996/MTH895 family glutaredoxin-like protein [Deltaproteobacteria bacterium]MBW2132979.1 TM0996/MTH895 family glutaredoxin-like protein [Deltaproteobacteria bacterium]